MFRFVQFNNVKEIFLPRDLLGSGTLCLCVQMLRSHVNKIL